MISIQNKQRSIAVDIKKLEHAASLMLAALNYHDFDLGIMLTTNKTIQKYNRDFRKKDKPTDILSFPYHTALKPGKRIKVTYEEDKNLGDIIIALEYTKKSAEQDWNCTLEERLIVLLAHGIAHCLGHDHETVEEFKTMQKVEKKLLKSVKI